MPSEKILDQKKQLVVELTEKMQKATSGVFVDYIGLTVEEDTNLRAAFRKAGVTYKVYKNSIMRFASQNAGYADLDPHFNGPTALAMSETDVTAPAKVVAEFAKKHEVFGIKAGFVEGKIIDANEVKAIASLPSKEELIAKMLGSFNAPITGFVTVLNGTMKGLAVALNAIAEKKAAAGE